MKKKKTSGKWQVLFEEIDKNKNNNSNNKEYYTEFPNCVKGYVVIGNGFRPHVNSHPKCSNLRPGRFFDFIELK